VISVRPARLTLCLASWLLSALAAIAGAAAAKNEGLIPPRPIERIAPEHPAALLAQRVVGDADILITVDTEGIPRDLKVEFASMPEFGPAALAAVARWKFSPALRDGKPAPLRIRVPIGFGFPDAEIEQFERERSKTLPPSTYPTLSAEEVDTLPELTKEAKPKFPPQIKAGDPMGEALIGLLVDETGEPRDIHTISTTHPAYAEASLQAIRRWKFKPGQLKGQAVRTQLRVIMNFTPDDPENAGPRVKPGVVHYVPERDEARFRDADPSQTGLELPQPISRKPPVYPRAAGRSSVRRATVDMVINEYGVVTHVRCSSSDHPYFAVEAERAVSYWRFTPARYNGVPIAIHARQVMIFDPKG